MVALYSQGARPTYYSGNDLPRPGASFYGEATTTLFDPDLNHMVFSHSSIAAKDLWASSSREVLIYVGGTTDDYVTLTLPEGCDFFDGETGCAENTWGPFEVRRSTGELLTDDAYACTSVPGGPDEFGLHLIDGLDDFDDLPCTGNSLSTLGHEDLGRIFVTLDTDDDWRYGVASHWNEDGEPDQPGAILIR